MTYLDHAASTPADPRVVEAMLPWFVDHHANASSPHRYGRRAARAVRHAREAVAGLIGCEPARVVFTSGATEALNIAISMAAALADPRRGLAVVGATEHKAVLQAADAHSRGVTVRRIAPQSSGWVSVDQVAEIAGRAAWGSFMAVNNETGAANPYTDIARTLRASGSVSVIDLTQAVGKLPVRLDDNVDLAALSGHKFGGPQGVGALVVPERRPDAWQPLVVGGSQERGFRPGTPNVPGIVGLGEAARLAARELDQRTASVRATAEAFLAALLVGSPNAPIVNGEPGVPHILNLWIPGVDNTILPARCRDLAFATGSACNSDLPEPSHVLLAMGMHHDRASQSIRVSFSHTTSVEEAVDAAKVISAEAAAIREMTAT